MGIERGHGEQDIVEVDLTSERALWEIFRPEAVEVAAAGTREHIAELALRFVRSGGGFIAIPVTALVTWWVLSL